MVKPNNLNNDLNVEFVQKLLFGKSRMSNDQENNIGLNYGSRKAIALDNYQIYQDTVIANLNVSKIIGYQKHPKSMLN